MTIRLKKGFDPMKWLCDRLARPHPAAGLLDQVGELLTGGRLRPAWAGAPMDPRANILLALNAGPDPATHPAPQKPKAHHGYKSPKTLEDVFLDAPEAGTQERFNQSLANSNKVCADDRYRGMHGVPCKYAGGTDVKCPVGTVSGWFWKYNTGKGVYYYVDCCGSGPTRQYAVWCNWVDESNWCLGSKGDWFGKRPDGVNGLASVKGITDYGCTLSIPDADFVAARVNDPEIADHDFFQVMGVDR